MASPFCLATTLRVEKERPSSGSTSKSMGTVGFRPKKISMQAVCVQRLCNGLISGHQTLRDYLPAKNALLGEQAVADKVSSSVCWGQSVQHLGKTRHGTP